LLREEARKETGNVRGNIARVEQTHLACYDGTAAIVGADADVDPVIVIDDDRNRSYVTENNDRLKSLAGDCLLLNRFAYRVPRW
jgi:hypothetical protein